MLAFKYSMRNKADRLASDLDKVLNKDVINPHRAKWLLRYSQVVNYASVNGLTIVKFGTKAETIRKWIATGHVFFEDNKAVSLQEIGLTFYAGHR